MDVFLCFGIFTALLAALYLFICVLGQSAPFNGVGCSLVDMFRWGSDDHVPRGGVSSLVYVSGDKFVLRVQSEKY